MDRAMLRLVAVVTVWIGCGISQPVGPLCHDDRPAQAAGTLADPTLCHCRPEAGPVICAAGAVCVYAACSGANQGAACALAGGARGTCCNGTCSELNLYSDPSNCGGCGNVCPEGATCSSNVCLFPYGATLTCTSGLIATHATCVGSSCVACVATSCAGLPDGAPCAVQPDAGQEQTAGLCCRGTCVNWFADDHNCGGCGVTCCAGTHCNLDAYANFSIAGICL